MNDANMTQLVGTEQLAESTPSSQNHAAQSVDSRSERGIRHAIFGARSLLKMLDQFPPWLVIGLAHDPATGKALSYAQICERAKVSMRTVCRLSNDKSWGRYDVKLVSAVMAACGFAPCDLPSMRRYLLKTTQTSAPFRMLRRKFTRRLKKLYRIGAEVLNEINAIDDP